MSYDLSDNEYQDAPGLPADERFAYFVEKVVEGDQVWSLKGPDGWVVMSSEDQEECLPVWPHQAFAADWATGDWSDCAPAPIALDAWLERWTPGMEKDGTQVAVFPAEEGEGLVLSPRELREAIELELGGV